MSSDQRRVPLSEESASIFEMPREKILKGMNKSPKGLAQSANSDRITLLLEAAMDIIRSYLGPFDKGVPKDKSRDVILGLLGQRPVAREVARRTGESEDTVYNRYKNYWLTSDRQAADILRFILASEQYFNVEKKQLAEQSALLGVSDDLVEAIHAVGYQSLKSRIGRTCFRFQLLAGAASDGDEEIQGAISEYYEEAVNFWRPRYQSMIEEHGLRLREGITLDDMISMMAAEAEGLALRAISDPRANVLDDQARRSLLGKFAIAFLVACTEPANSPTETTIEQSLADMISKASGRSP